MLYCLDDIKEKRGAFGINTKHENKVKVPGGKPNHLILSNILGHSVNNIKWLVVLVNCEAAPSE